MAAAQPTSQDPVSPRTKAKADAHHADVTLGHCQQEAIKVGGVIEQITKQSEEADRRLDREVKAHDTTKQKSRATEDEYNRMTQSINGERENNQAAQARLMELDKFQGKSGVALKAMQDDLMAVKLQNEALQAELDIQKKAFAVSVRWESMYGELKAKHDDHEREHEGFYNQYIQRRNALDSAMAAQEECRSARDAVLMALDRARADLAQGDELMKAAFATEELAGSLGPQELAKLQEQMAKSADLRKAQRERAKAALSKSCAGNDATLISTCWTCWTTETKGEKLQKEKKKQGHAIAARAMATGSAAIQDFALTAWYGVVQEDKAKKQKEANRVLEEKCEAAGADAASARRKALAQLEKQFGNKLKALMREVHHSWVNMKMDRLKVEKAIAVAGRNIASCDSAILTQVFQGWLHLLRDLQRRREKKSSSMGRGMRMIADGDNALKDFCLTSWAGLTKTALAEHKQTEAGHVKCARMMASNAAGTLAQVVAEWHEICVKKNDVAKKMKAVERNMSAMMGAMLQLTYKEWKGETERHKHSQQKKAVGMQQSAKKIAITTSALQMEVLQLWAQECRKETQERLQQDLEAKKNAPPVPDEAMIQCQKDLADLLVKLSTAKETQQEIDDRLAVNDSSTKETEAALANTERQMEKASADLLDSRRKAKDINEELARVSAFLLSKPRKPSSRPTSGTTKADDAKLPPLGGTMPRAPNTAREYRPDSARSLKGSSIGADAAPGSTKQAWASP